MRKTGIGIAALALLALPVAAQVRGGSGAGPRDDKIEDEVNAAMSDLNAAFADVEALAAKAEAGAAAGDNAATDNMHAPDTDAGMDAKAAAPATPPPPKG